ncbi:hypothetical protein FRB94_012350 [Tulasnella sp. JGI-2019a]|nr:hypothetical protein FRB94_012350 [Tulasnella sp. JGI-2019a]
MTAVHIALTFSASTTFAICLSLEAEALPKRLANGPNLATDAGDDQSPPVGTALGFSPCFIDARFALAHHRFRRRSKPVGTVFGFSPCFIVRCTDRFSSPPIQVSIQARRDRLRFLAVFHCSPPIQATIQARRDRRRPPAMSH